MTFETIPRIKQRRVYPSIHDFVLNVSLVLRSLLLFLKKERLKNDKEEID